MSFTFEGRGLRLSQVVARKKRSRRLSPSIFHRHALTRLGRQVRSQADSLALVVAIEENLDINI